MDIIIDGDAAMADHRQRGTRHVTVLVNAGISQHGRAGLCRIRNVSADGLAVETSMSLSVGAEAVVTLSSGREAPCVVRWVRDGRAGMSCATDLTALLLKERTGRSIPRAGPALPRIASTARTAIHVYGRPQPCQLDSLSTGDVLLRETPALDMHQAVLVEIAGLGTFPAVVSIWEDGDLFARFTPPLSFRLLDAWAVEQG